MVLHIVPVVVVAFEMAVVASEPPVEPAQNLMPSATWLLQRGQIINEPPSIGTLF